MLRRLLIMGVALAASACHRAPHTGLDFSGDYPERLSEWRLLEQRDGKLVPNEGVTPYDLNSPLFSDYAHKLRTIVLPEGTSIFTTYFAPADFNETVNTIGKRMYAKSFVDPELQRFTKLHAQSNPLSICLRPRAVIRVRIAT